MGDERYPWVKLWRKPLLGDEKLRALSPAAFRAFIYSLAAADREEKIGCLHHAGKALTVRQKATVWGCSIGAVKPIEDALLAGEFMIVDGRFTPPLLKVRNYHKWQVGNGPSDCSLSEQQCSLSEQQRSLTEQQCSLSERICSLSEQWRSLTEQGHRNNAPAVVGVMTALDALLCSLPEHVVADNALLQEVRERLENVRENKPASRIGFVPGQQPRPSGVPDDLPALKQNEMELNAEVRNVLRDRPQGKRVDDWFAALLAFTRDYPREYTIAGMLKALREDPPKSKDAFADQWVRRVFPEAKGAGPVEVMSTVDRKRLRIMSGEVN